MANIHNRLAAAARVLYAVERRRALTGEMAAGASIERHVIERELAELEEQIQADPGPLAAVLVKKS